MRRLSRKHFYLIMSSIMGITGIFLSVWVENQFRTINQTANPTIFYYAGIFLLVASVITYLIPIVIPPRTSNVSPPLTLKCPVCKEKLIFTEEKYYKCPECGFTIDSSPVLISLRDLAALVDIAALGCERMCPLLSRSGFCRALVKYAKLVGASLPPDCPLLHSTNKSINKKKK